MKNAKIVFAALSLAAACGGLLALSACKHRHAFSEWETVKSATCTEQGEKKRVCGCGEEEKEIIPATGHSFGGFSATESGHKKVCANGCGTESEAGAHEFNADNVCTVCGYALVYTASLTYSEVTEEEGGAVVGYAVTGCDENPTKITVPAYHEGLPVTAIGEYAFYKEEGNATLRKITLPSTVKEIGAYAFYECSALEEIDLGRVETIGDYAFILSGLKEIVLPESLTSIGKQALQQCDNLTTVTFRCAPAFGEYLFYMSPNVKTIIIGHNETAFTDDTFYGFEDGSVDFIFGDGVTEIAPSALGGTFVFKNTFAGSVKIGKNVEKIGSDAFVGSNITQIEFPASLKEIGSSAFEKCEKLKKIQIPEGVETIKNSAFIDCTALEEVSFPKSLKTIGSSAFGRCSSVTKVSYAGTVAEWSQMEIGSNANPIQNFASFWANGEEITGELVIDGVETIKMNVFCGIGVESIVLGESVKRVEQQAFGQDTKLPRRAFKRIVILNKECKVANSLAFGYREGGGETEILYKGTAEEIKENTNLSANLHYFKDCKLYFYSEAPETEEIPAADSSYKFAGFWKYASDGKKIEKTERTLTES